MAILKPSPGAPIMAEAGTRTRSNFSRASGCGAMTSMRSATEKPGNFAGQQKSGKALGAGAFAGAREHDVKVGDAAVGNPGLFAVEDIAVAVALGGQRDIGDIGAGLLLGQREGGDRAAAARALEPVALLGVAEQADRPGAEALHGEGEIGKAVVARQRFADEAERAHIERCRRVGIGRGMREPAVAAEFLHKIAAGGIDVAVIRRQVRRAPLLDGSRPARDGGR